MEAGILDGGRREESFRDGWRKFFHNGLIPFLSFLFY